jgi:hypothetical protein
MRQRDYKSSTRVGYRNRPRQLPARTIISEYAEKDGPDYYDYYCCYDCHYGDSPKFNVGASVIFRIPGSDADCCKPGPGWLTGEIIFVNTNEGGYPLSYEIRPDRPIPFRGFHCEPITVSTHRVLEVDALDRLAGIF